MMMRMEAPAQKATILIVDDELSNIEIINAALGDEYEISFATSGEQALRLAAVLQPDLVLLDIVMPGLQGFEVCQRLKADQWLANVPIIFTTGLEDAQDEIHGLSLGAIDYVRKPIEPVILRNRVKNHIELKQLRDQLARLAVTDGLTGLGNRRYLESMLDDTVTALADRGAWLSVVMVDIDFFKQFNDTYGHPSGDRCIRMVASALNRATQAAEGFSARYGGEEFTCVLPGADAAQAMRVANDIRAQVRQLQIPHERSSISAFVTTSIGIASARARPELAAGYWTRAADEQLYQAKLAGRDLIRTRDLSPHAM